MLLATQDAAVQPGPALSLLFVLGRLAFAAIFILSGIGHLTRLAAMSQYAAAFKVPQPRLAVIITGVMILTGGLSLLLGIQVRAGALLLTVFLLAAALYMHPFWGPQDPMQAANQQAHFLKNLSLAGAALVIYYFSALHPDAWVYAVGR
jgi:putative oxidoreductase